MAIDLPNINNIHIAIERYMRSYYRQFEGSRDDYVKLNNLLVEKLREVKILAPNFYANRLPTLVNQAATRLNVNKKEVNNNHRIFLLILDSLIVSQPEGPVDFETEKRHIEVLDKLHKKQRELRAQERELSAQEVDWDNDGPDCIYNKIGAVKNKLLRVSRVIAKLHNLREEEVVFTLSPKPGQALENLQRTKPALYNKIDAAVNKIMSNRTKGRAKRELPDKVLVTQTLTDALDSSIKSDDLKLILEEIYGSLRDHFRNIDRARTEEQHAYYINSNYLLPKEGEILTDPDNLPPEVLYQLNKNYALGEEKMNRIYDVFAKKRRLEDDDDESRKVLVSQNGPIKLPADKGGGPEAESNIYESSDEEDGREEDEDEESSEEEEDEDDVEVLDIGITNQDVRMFVRVKEEPPERPARPAAEGSREKEVSSELNVQPVTNGSCEKEVSPEPTVPAAVDGSCGKISSMDKSDTETRTSAATDPFSALQNMLKEQQKILMKLPEAVEEEEEEDSVVDHDVQETEIDADCELIQCFSKDDKIQTVDLSDDD